MFFTASKIFWLVAQPISAIFILLTAGWIFSWRGMRRTALWLHGGALVLFALTCFTNLGEVLIQPLEDRFGRPAQMPEQIAAIVVLGGSTDGKIGFARDVVELSAAGDRMTEAVVLARLYPQAPVLVSGGVGGVGALAGGEGVDTDAGSGARFLERQGIAPERILMDDSSRNTDENAANSRDVLSGARGPIVLVTSAFHMPRSVGLYRAEGFEVIAWPTDYRSTGQAGFSVAPFEPLGNLEALSTALREWIGLAAYAATGRIGSVFPGP